MEKEFIIIIMEILTKDNGKMINAKEKLLYILIMEIEKWVTIQMEIKLENMLLFLIVEMFLLKYFKNNIYKIYKFN